LGPRLYRRPSELDRALDGVRPVVDPGQDVAVQVDHSGCRTARAASAVRARNGARAPGETSQGARGYDRRAGSGERAEERPRRSMFKSIVLGTDGSDTATQAVRQAVGLASAIGAKVQLVSAYEPVSEQRLKEERKEAPEDLQWAIGPREEVDATLEAAAALAREVSVPVELYARQGDPADAILDVAEEQGADLIVVGNKGMTGAKRFLLGSVPNKISHHAPCSVLIIRTT